MYELIKLKDTNYTFSRVETESLKTAIHHGYKYAVAVTTETTYWDDCWFLLTQQPVEKNRKKHNVLLIAFQSQEEVEEFNEDNSAFLIDVDRVIYLQVEKS